MAMKANGIVLATTALVSTIDASAFGHALVHLRCPPRLAHLLLFTVRYMETLHAEAVRLRRAMRARAFRPRMTAHAYRSLAALVGILLVRSLDRSERVLAAMKCRGFRGEFFVLRHFHWRASDSAFSVAAAAAIAGLVVWGNV
jgi:cobalt/nickel transport system permease protein